MKREDFDGTYFDVSEWTEEMKINFQLRCFELGYKWCGRTACVCNLDANRYYLAGLKSGTGFITYARSQYKSKDHSVEKHYADMFPEETPAPQFTQEELIQYIVDQVEERKSVDEDSEEDGRGFEGLLLNKSCISNYEMWVIFCKDLSTEQLKFMESTFNLDRRYTPNVGCQDVVMGDFESMCMWSNQSSDFLPSLSSKVISFNNLFKYNEDL